MKLSQSYFNLRLPGSYLVCNYLITSVPFNLFLFLFFSVGGHDSKEDAVAALDLMKYKVKQDLGRGIKF